MFSLEEYLLRLLCELDAACPCGGDFVDYHSHTRDCCVIGGAKAYSVEDVHK